MNLFQFTHTSIVNLDQIDAITHLPTRGDLTLHRAQGGNLEIREMDAITQAAWTTTFRRLLATNAFAEINERVVIRCDAISEIVDRRSSEGGGVSLMLASGSSFSARQPYATSVFNLLSEKSGSIQ